MLNKIVGLSILFVAFSTTAFAVPEVTAPAVPKNLHVFSTSGNAYVDHVAQGCSGIRYEINADHIKYDTIISILLAAQIAGKQVILRFDGCNAIPQGQVIGVYLP